MPAGSGAPRAGAHRGAACLLRQAGFARGTDGSCRSEWGAASNAVVHFRRDLARDVQHAGGFSHGGLEVGAVKGEEHAQAKHGQETEHEGRIAVVLLHVIGVPTDLLGTVTMPMR